jgi:quercetin dioxygenase-like cupin family protein
MHLHYPVASLARWTQPAIRPDYSTGGRVFKSHSFYPIPLYVRMGNEYNDCALAEDHLLAESLCLRNHGAIEMIVRNIREVEPRTGPSHSGKGNAREVRVFSEKDFDTNLRFIIHSELAPGTSVGYHKHGDNEEVYVVLEGRGLMTVNDEKREVVAGDVIVNKPGWSHGLENNSDLPLKILVFEVAGGKNA